MLCEQWMLNEPLDRHVSNCRCWWSNEDYKQWMINEPLDAHVSNRRCWWSYEDYSFFLTLLSKLGILRQKPVARMDCLHSTQHMLRRSLLQLFFFVLFSSEQIPHPKTFHSWTLKTKYHSYKEIFKTYFCLLTFWQRNFKFQILGFS